MGVFVLDVGGRDDVVEGEFKNTFPASLIHYYLALRAYNRFIEKHSRRPGVEDDTVESDTVELISLVSQILSEEPANPEMVCNACAEMFVPLLSPFHCFWVDADA